MYERTSKDMGDLMQPSKHRYNLKSRFDVIKSLGSGTYGKVKLAMDRKTGQKVIIANI